MIVALTLFVLIFSVTGLPAVHGPIVQSLGASPYAMTMSSDARVIVLTFASLKNAEVFQNNGHGFQYHQTLPNSESSLDITMTKDGTYVYLNSFAERKVLIFKAVGGGYELFQNVLNPSAQASVQCSFKGE